MHWNELFTKEDVLESLRKAPFYRERITVFEEQVHSTSIDVLKSTAKILKDIAMLISEKDKKTSWSDSEISKEILCWLRRKKRKISPGNKSFKNRFAHHIRLAIFLLRELRRYQEPELWVKKVCENISFQRKSSSLPFFKERGEIISEYIQKKYDRITLRRMLSALNTAAICIDKEPAHRYFTEKDIKQIIVSYWKSHYKSAYTGKTYHYKMMAELIKKIGRYEQMPDDLHEYHDIIENSLNGKEYSQSTRETYYKHLRRFLSFLVKRGVSLKKISPEDIQAFYSHIEYLSPRTKNGMLSYLRYWLKDCESKNMIPSHIANSILVPRIWKFSSMPCVYDWSIIKKIIELDDIDIRCRMRNKAILLLLTTYGFRASEICSMMIDDINWDTSSFFIAHTKNFTQNNYPLEANVGNAIVRYLLDERPKTDDRHLFLQCIVPYRPITIHVVGGIVAARVKKLGIIGKRKGAHTMRHSLATHLLEVGVPRKEISDILGHKNYSSLQFYAKVSKTALRSVIMDDDLEDLL